ncbi:Transporter [Rhynchospora pubera]|uniref:Transporter n=1 Tax=Rhynchospora pubera TaxID=906938 RepID=A0AAV8EXN1_9POAL|nr:Transporter [Rhynchospora pubera]
MIAPLYISEASPERIRGALVSMNGLLITRGQFLSHLINLAFTKEPGAWRWMLGIAGLPTLVQVLLMLSLRKIYPAHEVESEIGALCQSVDKEIAQEGGVGEEGLFGKLKKALSNTVVLRGLAAGIQSQVAQQFVGINSVMYYSPTIVQLSGFASNSTALALSLITRGLNAVGSIVRRRLMLISLVGIVACLAMLSGIFFAAASHSSLVGETETQFFGNATCSDYKIDSGIRCKCTDCLKAAADCGFCANTPNKIQPGACLASNDLTKDTCHANHRDFKTKGLQFEEVESMLEDKGYKPWKTRKNTTPQP